MGDDLYALEKKKVYHPRLGIPSSPRPKLTHQRKDLCSGSRSPTLSGLVISFWLNYNIYM